MGASPVPERKADLKKDDFPALPSSAPAAPKKLDTSTWGGKLPAYASDLPLSPPVGKWDEEVEAMDAKSRTS
jgi:hypothetical protein